MTERDYTDMVNLTRLCSMLQVSDGIYWFEQPDRKERYETAIGAISKLSDEMATEMAKRARIGK
jgi:hypothetical protein